MSVGLSWKLVFGQAGVGYAQPYIFNSKSQVVPEKVILNQLHEALKSTLEIRCGDLGKLSSPGSRAKNDREVILIKTGDSAPSVPTSPVRGQPSNFPTPPSGGRPSRPVYVPKYRTAPKVVPGVGAAANPAGGGNGGVAPEFDDNKPSSKKEQSQESKTFDYQYRSNDPKKKKESEDQCSIDEQNKAGIDELPDSSEFRYNLETKTVKKALKKLWKNPEARKEVLAGLDKMKKGELLPRNQKDFKGFKTLKEIKLNKSRMLVQPKKNGAPDTIVAIFMRRDINDVVLGFKNKYK